VLSHSLKKKKKMKRVHCIGVLDESGGNGGNANDIFLLVQVRVTKPSRMRLVRLLLDDISVNLCSPFYEHDVILEEEKGQSSSLSSYCVLKRWYAAHLRIKLSDDKSEQALANNIKTIIRQSFYPLMARPSGGDDSGTKPWQRHFFHWDLWHKGMASHYQPHFALEKWLALAKGPPPPTDIDEESTVDPGDFDDNNDPDDGNDDGESKQRNIDDRIQLVRKKATGGSAHGPLEHTVKDYWAKFAAAHKQELDEFVKLLGIKTADVIVNDVRYLYRVLDNYRLAYVTSYMRCRFLEMATMVILKNLDGKDGDGCADKRLCTGNLSYGTVNDLLRFYNEMESVVSDSDSNDNDNDNDTGYPREYKVSDYFNFGALIDALVSAGKLVSTLECLVNDNGAKKKKKKKKKRDDSIDIDIESGDDEDDDIDDEKKPLTDRQRQTRHELLRRVWVRKTLLELKKRAHESLSTVFPIDVGTVVYYYNRLFGLSGDVKDRVIYLDGSSLVADTVVNESRPCSITSFTNRHYVEALHVFVEAVATVTTASPSSTTSSDIVVVTSVHDRSQKLTTYTPLFLIKCKPVVNKSEEQLRLLFCEKMDKYCVIDNCGGGEDDSGGNGPHWSAQEWQERALSMDDIDQQLYQTRFVLLNVTPCEARAGHDLCVVRDLMAWNVFEVTLVRPNNSYHSLMRASLFFDKEEDEGESGLTLEHFHERFMDLKTLLQCGDMRGKKTILLVMDAHLLSVDDMVALLRWIHVKRLIRHVVMLGCTDALPLHTEGQAFCDLFNWVDYTTLSSNMFEKEAFHRDLIRLAHQAFKPDVNLFVCQRYGVLFSKCLVPFMSSRQRRHNVILYHIVRSSSGGGSVVKKDEHVEALEEQIDSAGGHAVSIRSTTLARLPFLNLTRHFESDWLFFIVTLQQLKRMDRNQLNHLFMVVPSLIVALTSPLVNNNSNDIVYNPAKTNPLKFLRKSLQMQLFPNHRYTLPYVTHWEKQRREGCSSIDG